MAKESIEDLVRQGTDLLSAVNSNLEGSVVLFKKWQIILQTRLQELGISKDEIANILVAMHYKQIKFSEEESKKKLTEAIQRTVMILNELQRSRIGVSVMGELSEAAALTVIRRTLDNFHLHIKEMYQEKVHGNGTFNQEDLAKIVIGNEYDIQRMLYSLLRPIFPTVRSEVHDDTGYSGLRYDINLREYDIVIEVKCSRPSMRERVLTEELGADAFHYKAKYLFMFIYDKDNIIKNTEAFKKAYKRDSTQFDKNIETFIVQSVRL